MNPIECVGALCGVLGVWLTARKSVWCFPIGLINVAITAWLVYGAHLYADALQQLMYFVLLAYGWIMWQHNNSANMVSAFGHPYQWPITILAIAMVTCLLYALLTVYTAAHFALWDSLGTAICFTAQYLVAKRKVENWLLWIPANIIYIVLYYYKQMPFYAVLSAIYLVLAILGYKQWQQWASPHKPYSPSTHK